MRFFLILFSAISFALLAAGAANAFVSGSANITKENSYVVVGPPSDNSLIAKENAYAVIMPPCCRATIAKENAYAIVTPLYPSVEINP